MDSFVEVVNVDTAMCKELTVLNHKLNSGHQNVYLNVLATHQMVHLFKIKYYVLLVILCRTKDFN